MKWTSAPTWKVALLPALAVAALTCVLLFFQHRLLDNELRERALVRNQQRADVLALQLQLALRDAVHQVRQLAHSPLMQPTTPTARMRAELDRVVNESPRFVWIGLTAPDGRVLAGSRGWLEGASIAQRPVFAKGREGMVGNAHPAVALAPLLSKLPGGASELIDVGEPVRDDNGNLVAVVTAHLGLTWVKAQIELGLGNPDTMRELGLQALVLTGPDGRSLVPGAARPAGLPKDLAQARAWDDAKGDTFLVAEAELRSDAGEAPLLPWRTLVLQAEDTALAPSDLLTSAMLSVGVLATLILAAAGAMAARRLLAAWEPVFTAVAEGHSPASVAERVEALVAQRSQPTATEVLIGWLARDAGNLRRALEHLPVALALADRDFRCDYVNPAFTRLLGWTMESMRNRPVGDLLVDAGDRGGLARVHRQLGQTPGEFVSRLDALTPDGQQVAVQCHLVPMVDAAGQVVGTLTLVHDIRAERTARAQAEAMAGRLRALADAAVDTLLATLDLDGRVLEWSHGAERLSGQPASVVIGRTLDSVLPGAQDAQAWLRQARIDGQHAVSLRACRPSGEDCHYEGSIYSLGLAPGCARFGVLLRDTTDQSRARETLASSEARLSAIVDTASDAIISVNAEGRIIVFNPAAERIFGHPLSRMLGQPLEALLPEPARQRHHSFVENFAHSGVTRRSMGVGHVLGTHADGRTLQLEASISQAVANGQIVLTAILRDVTERVGQERLIETARDELAQLNRRLLEQEKESSRRLAQALHDELGQTLAALRLHWDAYRHAQPETRERMEARIADLVVHANHQIRDVLSDLRPPLLDELGLAAALDNELRQHLAVDETVDVTLAASPESQQERWPADVEYACFMVAREALLNALQHASARHIRVRLDGDAHRLALRVTDDGIGIEAKSQDGRPGHLGLIGMRERAHAIGATLLIDGAAGHGTMVELTWEAANADHDEPHLPD